jgi:DNA (cytosine-5)-methyltransferase 1
MDPATENKILKIGSLFSGYGGLDLAVEKVFNAKVAWHCEREKGPLKVLKAHWPNVPNHGDITNVDFTQVEPVDILTGGFPCQDLSVAGARRGLTEGTRSNLWTEFYRAIIELRPRFVVIENVRGLLSAKAYSSLELQSGVVGFDGSKPILRAMGAVAGDLAGIGYDCRWTTVRASEVNAPHMRERVFIIATTNTKGS